MTSRRSTKVANSVQGIGYGESNTVTGHGSLGDPNEERAPKPDSCTAAKGLSYSITPSARLRAWIGPSPKMAGVIIGSNAATCSRPGTNSRTGGKPSKGRNTMTRHVMPVRFASALVLGGALVTGAV